MKTLGLDIGTNSIGWGLVDEHAQKIEKCGVYIFPEGVKKEKGNESSKAAERTSFRSARRLKFRRKLRKYETLKVLVKNEMCPLSMEELEKWHCKKEYPTSKAFIDWYRTDETNNWEPYFLRKKCVEEKCEKFEIGRALYHIAQRRGFLTNRKDYSEESENAETKGIKGQINELTALKGDKTLGQYFYELKQSGEKVRGRYTSRKEHYEEEFNKICEVQGIADSFKTDLHNAIFFQRKLKSQKFLVGKCTLETDKPRCPISHFEFEEFRMLSLINSIRINRKSNNDNEPSLFSDLDFGEHYPDDGKLTKEEIESIVPLFFRSSKLNFDFKDISKKLKKDDEWTFNYRDDTNVAGCPVSTALKNIFGDDWKNIKIPNDDSSSNKKYYDIYDIWHVLFDFDDDQKLHEFALNKLHLDSEKTEKFCKIHFQQGYANLSLKAIRKILPFLRKGYVYSHAAFLANIPTMIGQSVYDAHAKEIENAVENVLSSLKDKNNVITLANRCIEAVFKDENHDFHSEEWDKTIFDSQVADLFGKRKWSEKPLSEQKQIRDEVISKVEDTLKIVTTKTPNDYKYKALRTDDLIMEYLSAQGFEIKKNAKLYHPSEMGKPDPQQGEDGKLYLGSPRTPSVKNPVAMRALHQLRKLINYLIKIGEVDSDTRVHVELANEVNDKNWRKAIEEFQKDNEKKNAEYKARIIELCKECGFDIVPTDDDIKKYRLWKEQNEMCPYTGKKINITDLFGPNPKFDFEHTIPRSLSYDDSLENLTLCDSDFNRNVKKQHIPSELANYEEISKRFGKFYETKIDECLSAIERNITRGGYIDPSVKDMRIVKRHKAQLELDYYKGKLRRFTAKEVTSGFKHSQLNDTRIITKFALNYLRSVFQYTYPVKGSMTDTFKRQWGLLDRAESKDRSNYRHHAVDALTIACVDRRKFNLLSEAIRASTDGTHLKFAKPWESFDKDVLNAVQYIIPKHFVDDNSLRQSKKVLRDRDGKPRLDKNGNKIYIKGDTVRGSLHKDTFYGRIMTPPEKGVEPQKIFVQRVETKSLVIENNKLCKNISTIIEKNSDKIIDKGIQKTFIENLKSGKQTPEDIFEKGILLPYKLNGKDSYVKRVRVMARTTSPIILKQHHNVIDKNPKDYKQNYYVVNDENYLIALYRGKDAKGKDTACSLTLNLLDAIKAKNSGNELYPDNKNGMDLYKVLKIGRIVILQDNYDEDIWSLSYEQVWKRMFRVAGLGKSGNRVFICLAHITQSGAWQYIPGKFDLNTFIESRRYQDNQFIGLVEGEDFSISPAGEIIKK